MEDTYRTVHAVPKPASDSKLAKRRIKAKATSHEYRAAKALGGRRVSQSGAGIYEKGDVSVDNLPTPLFVEVKSVSTLDARAGAQSVSFKRDWLDKSIADAKAAGKLPVVTMRFSDGEPVYMTTAKVFEALITQLQQYYELAKANPTTPPLTFDEGLALLREMYTLERYKK